MLTLRTQAIAHFLSHTVSVDKPLLRRSASVISHCSQPSPLSGAQSNAAVQVNAVAD